MCINSSFFLSLSHILFVWLYHNFFIHRSVDEHLNCFQLLATIDKAAVIDITFLIFPWFLFYRQFYFWEVSEQDNIFGNILQCLNFCCKSLVLSKQHIPCSVVSFNLSANRNYRPVSGLLHQATCLQKQATKIPSGDELIMTKGIFELQVKVSIIFTSCQKGIKYALYFQFISVVVFVSLMDQALDNCLVDPFFLTWLWGQEPIPLPKEHN